MFSATALGCMAWIYRRHGTSGQITVVLYVCSLVATQWSMKAFFMTYPTLNYPFWLTSLHSMAQFVATEAILRSQEVPTNFIALVKEQGVSRYLCIMGPIAAVIALSICMNNASLLYIGMGLNSIVSSLTPVPTAILSRLGGKQYPLTAWIGIFIASSGGLIVLYSEATQAYTTPRATLGVTCAGIALLLRAAKTTLQDSLLNAHGGLAPSFRKLLPMELIVLQSPLMFTVYSLLSFVFEGIQPYEALWALRQRHTSLFTGALEAASLTAGAALALAWFGMMALKILGAPAMQIAGKLNVLITASFAVIFMNEELQTDEVIGGMLALTGAYIFETSLHSASQDGKGVLEELYKRKEAV